MPQIEQIDSQLQLAQADDNGEEEKVQIRFSQEDHKNSVVSFKGSGNTNEADERVINEFKRRSIIKSSFCDDLKLKDMSVKIQTSCIGRDVKIGKNVSIKDSVIMNHVTIKDDVTIVNSVVSSSCKIGIGNKIENAELQLKTSLPDKKGNQGGNSSTRRGSMLPQD